MEFEKTVILDKAGSLDKHITYSERKNLFSLKIEGVLNADDVNQVLDEMCTTEGHYEGEVPNDVFVEDIESSPKLRILDLSECRFEGGATFPNMGFYTLLQYFAFPQGVKVICESDYSGFECASMLQTVVLPQGVKTVEGFNGCEQLSEISLPDSVEVIGDYAFSYCRKLKTMFIPRNVRYIGSGAFAQTGIQQFEIDPCNPFFTVVDGVIFSKDLKTLVAFPPAYRPHYDIPVGTETIGAGAFDDCNLDTIHIPDTVAKLGEQAFDCSGLHKVFIPDSVKEIGNMCFRGSSEMEQMRLPNGIQQLKCIISGCRKLKTLDVPASVKRLDMDNIAFCESLEHIFFHDGLEEIAGNSLALSRRGCLKEIFLPKTLKPFPGGLFHHCTDLKEFRVDADNPYMCAKEGSLYTKDMRTLLAVPDPFRQTFSVPEGVEEIGEFVFLCFVKLETILLPASLKRIGTRAFDFCHNLREIRLPKGVEEINYCAFDNCEKLQRMYIESSVPPTMQDFSSHWSFACNSKKLVISVPSGSLQEYKSAEGWKNLNIIEY